MEYIKKNIFDLENPEAYYCIATHYRRGHSELFVRVLPRHPNGPEPFFLIFQVVEYIEGPLVWDSANFCITTNDECQKLLNERGLDKYLKCGEAHSLFIVENEGVEFKVKIIAARNVGKLNNPGDFSWLFRASADV